MSKLIYGTNGAPPSNAWSSRDAGLHLATRFFF